MPKKIRSFRFEEEHIKMLTEIVDHFNDEEEKRLLQKGYAPHRPYNQTSVLETLIKLHRQKIKDMKKYKNS